MTADGSEASMPRHDATSATRRPTGQQLVLLRRLLGSKFRGAPELEKQLATTVVAPLDSNGSLRLHPVDTESAPVDRRIPVEASYPDVDHVIVHVLLHVIDGRLNELEVYRADSGAVVLSSTETDVLEVEVR